MSLMENKQLSKEMKIRQDKKTVAAGWMDGEGRESGRKECMREGVK